MGLVLEILVKGPGKSWNFSDYGVGGGHNDAGAGAKISLDFMCIQKEIAGGRGP